MSVTMLIVLYFGFYLQIRKAPNERFHRLIEFYDVRAAEAALVSLNKSEIAGRQIKLEPTRPSGAHVMYVYELVFRFVCFMFFFLFLG